MEQVDFGDLRRSFGQGRRIAGKYLELWEPEMTVDVWLELVGRKDRQVAAALAAHIRRTEDRWSPEWSAREANIQQAKDEFDAPLFPGIDMGIPPSSRTFEELLAREGYPSVAEAKSAVQAWAAGTDCPMVTLFGVPGTGKTHLALAAAGHLERLGRLCLYRSEGDLLGEAMERMGDHSTERLVSAACEVPWLILDDMGVSALSDWGQGTMDRIIDSRYQLAQREAGFTLITTNVTGDGLSPRVRRRLTEPEVSRVLQIKAPSYYETTQMVRPQRERR